MLSFINEDKTTKNITFSLWKPPAPIIERKIGIEVSLSTLFKFFNAHNFQILP